MKGMTNYDRASAVKYAHKWAFERNPRFYNYDKVGGLYKFCVPMPAGGEQRYELYTDFGLVLC